LSADAAIPAEQLHALVRWHVDGILGRAGFRVRFDESTPSDFVTLFQGDTTAISISWDSREGYFDVKTYSVHGDELDLARPVYLESLLKSFAVDWLGPPHGKIGSPSESHALRLAVSLAEMLQRVAPHLEHESSE
jgi:hypothetical protein